MKSLFFLFALTSFSSMAACPEITGKFLCEEHADYGDIFESQEISLNKHSGKDVYTFSDGSESLDIEVGKWIEADFPELQTKIFTTGECKETQFNIIQRMGDTPSETESLEMLMEFIPVGNDLDLRFSMMGEEAFKVNCKKI